MHSPADASTSPSRMPPHGSGPRWLAGPSSWWTRTTYSLPVSRRTQIKSKLLQLKHPLFHRLRRDRLCQRAEPEVKCCNSLLLFVSGGKYTYSDGAGTETLSASVHLVRNSGVLLLGF